MQTSEIAAGQIINFRTGVRPYRGYFVSMLGTHDDHPGAMNIYQWVAPSATPVPEWVNFADILPRTLQLVSLPAPSAPGPVPGTSF